MAPGSTQKCSNPITSAITLSSADNVPAMTQFGYHGLLRNTFFNVKEEGVFGQSYGRRRSCAKSLSNK
jgi:hypothetical protein